MVPADQLIPEPDALSWEAAGSLDVVGTTAWAAVRSVNPAPEYVRLAIDLGVKPGR